MRELALHYGQIGIIVMLIPVPFCIALAMWSFKLRFCELYWSPACQMVVRARIAAILAVMLLGTNMFVMQRMAVHDVPAPALYAVAMLTIFTIAALLRSSMQMMRVLYRAPYDPQLKLPLGLPSA